MPRLLSLALLLAVAGCASTAPPLDASEVAGATASVAGLRDYVRDQGYVLFPDVSFDPGLFSTNRESFSVDGGRGRLSVYAFESEAAMEQAALRLSTAAFSPAWNVYEGGNLVVVYLGRDPGMLAALGRVMDAIA